MIQFLILVDTTKDPHVPMGLWAMSGDEFDQEYKEEYIEDQEYYRELFSEVDFSKISWRDFCSYWTTQGGYFKFFMGPYVDLGEASPAAFVQDNIGEIDKLYAKAMNNTLTTPAIFEITGEA